jgi:hypothetical protein
MAAFANLTLADGQASPVNHTFATSVFRTEKDGRLYYEWLDTSINGGVPIGANRIRMWITPMKVQGVGKAGESQYIIEGAIDSPVMEVLSNNTATGINPQPTLAYGTPVWFKTIRNGRSVPQPSKDVWAFLRNFSLSTVFTDALYSLNNPN